MQANQRRRLLAVPINTRGTTVASLLVALVVLALAAWLLSSFRGQRQAVRANESRLTAWNEQLLTATPAALDLARTQAVLAAEQERFGAVSARLPSENVESGALERIIEAAAQAGVELTTLREAGQTYSDGSIVVWGYEIGAEGDLARLIDFISRLEGELFPSAYVRDPVLSARPDGSYVMTGDLDVYGSTLSSSALLTGGPATQEDLAAKLREEAAAAMSRGDYELALSLLLRLAALTPDDPSVNQMLYDAYVAYGTALLARGLFDQARQQFEAALAINPNGAEAMAGVVAAAQGVTVTPSTGGEPTPPIAVAQTPPPGATAGVPPTAYIPPTPYVPPTAPVYATSTFPPPIIKEPNPPTVPLPPTQYVPPTVAPPGPSRTPEPTLTPPFTETPIPTPTLDVTPSFTPTLGPSPTATVNNGGMAFGALSPFYLPNCGLTQIKGTIRDSATNAPLNGVTVRVWWDGAAPTDVYSQPSGSDPTRGPGEWDVVLADYAKAGQWYVAVVDRATGQLLSQIQTVNTDTGSCQPGGAGHQVVNQDFVRYGSGPGVPGATLTASPIPSATPIPTFTPTRTATPTPTPLIFYKDENPDLVIPDGPNGIATSTLTVVSTATIRDARVFINIQHQDVGDLRITIVHPDGTRVLLKDAGQGTGQTSIRTYFPITGMAGKPITGDWVLEVVDAYEAKTGTLLSWSLEVFP